ncbi:M28 family peptidase [Eisenibacter elegans]|jgi:hypothetical protein|uniref:M28 family peptidase n=1 Tax=Eisenibacter elegans TaxID=997 RepID=UPI000412A3C2|nr:M28 family peptidase [Eisenibacter elegans]
MKKHRLFVGLCLAMLCCLQACNNSENTQNTQNTSSTPPLVLQPTPDFNADSAYAFIERQVAFGPRVPNTAAHRRCGEYLSQTLRGYGWEVMEQSFEARAYDSTLLQGRNIIASYNPQAAKRILLAAHWDTRHVADKDSVRKNEPFDGANDGGSGVGVLLEIARILGTVDTSLSNVGVDIILFDLEDYGYPENYEGQQTMESWCLGSQYWAKNKHRDNYSAYYGILLDMVGAKGARFYREGHSMQFAAGITQKVWGIAARLGYSSVFVNQQSPGIMDDHYYVNKIAKIPMIDIVEFNPEDGRSYFGHYHHTHADNMSIIDTATLKAVGQTVLQVIFNEAAPAS